MWWAERPQVGAPTIFKIHVQISIIYVGLKVGSLNWKQYKHDQKA